ncbi:dna-directed rna polymerase ii subunit rpb9 [Vairimorpha apis BRL 01]|uniref:Dna-directed rna polymerase ii subunit rpb9 n=1 Tax=Vairimorpha apis BRL 01 TaxID=1037528 RepID=T0L894_9MICR|nr:dna-directed rna polymerase ii subunit rpb9 [Vairimorpha apis BRL 01]
MNNEFCKECHNMLYPKSGNTEQTLLLICKSCDHIQEASSNRLSATYFKSRNYGYNTFAKDLANDPTLPKLRMQCKKCDNNIVVYFQNRDIEEEVAFDLVYICIKCFHYWTH